MKRYYLEITGELRPGANAGRAAATLAKLLRATPEQAARLLRGQPKRLGASLPVERAEHLRRTLEHVGIACRLAPAAAQAAPSNPTGAATQPAAEVEQPTMQCPKCGQTQPPAEICTSCGIVFAKYLAARQWQETPPVTDDTRAELRAERFPYQIVTQLLLLLLLTSVAVALWSHWRKDQFPPPVFYDLSRLGEPRQTETTLEPFQVTAEDIQYRIDPLFDYELDGVVVSLHDSDAFIDVYHFKDWKDFLNIRDLCVVWGDNVESGAFREMSYKNTTWTCWISTQDPIAAARFNWQQLSNNHVLAHEPYLYKAIKSAEVGDQIHFSGQLARYSHGGGFSRGTSVTRTDTGNGACETIFIREFSIVRKANSGWRLIWRLSSLLAALTLIPLTVLFFVAPYRPRR